MTYTLEPPLPKTETPDDYHRLQFDPKDVHYNRIVGLLACQRDPMLRSMPVQVVSANIAPPPPVSKKTAKKKAGDTRTSTPIASGAATPAPSDSETWEVVLSDTVIFPEGGGQPSDTGYIKMTDPNGEVRTFPVEMCVRKGLVATHRISVPKELVHVVEASPGTEVMVETNWEIRMDHMSMHTGQHLLSAVLDNFAESLLTLSWGMEAFPSLEPGYVELPRALTWAEAEDVERQCNEAIHKATKVWVEVSEQNPNFERVTGKGVRETKSIPTDYAGGVIRQVFIQDLDINACCGTQLPHLAHLGSLHVLPPGTPSTSHTPNKTQTRLYFVAGPRATAYLQKTSRTLSLISQVLGVGRSDTLERVIKQDAQRKELVKQEKDLRGLLVKSVAENVKLDESGIQWLKRTDKSTHDFDFIGNLAVTVQELHRSKLLVVTSVVPAEECSLLLILSQNQELAKKANDQLKAAFEAKLKGRYRGGGAKGRFMSKIMGDWTKVDEDLVQSTLAHIEE